MASLSRIVFLNSTMSSSSLVGDNKQRKGFHIPHRGARNQPRITHRLASTPPPHFFAPKTASPTTMAARGMSGAMQGPVPGMGPVMVLSKCFVYPIKEE